MKMPEESDNQGRGGGDDRGCHGNCRKGDGESGGEEPIDIEGHGGSSSLVSVWSGETIPPGTQDIASGVPVFENAGFLRFFHSSTRGRPFIKTKGWEISPKVGIGFFVASARHTG